MTMPAGCTRARTAVGLAAGAEARPNRFGLRGMRERLEGLGGALALQIYAGGARFNAEAVVPSIVAGAAVSLGDRTASDLLATSRALLGEPPAATAPAPTTQPMAPAPSAPRPAARAPPPPAPW